MKNIRSSQPCILMNFLINLVKHKFFHVSIANNKKQPPDVFYKKAVLKYFSVFQGKHLCWSLFLIKLSACRSATLLKRNSNTSGFLLNIAKCLKAHILRKICERLLLNSVYKGFSTFAGKCLCQSVVPALVFSDSHLKFLTILLKSIAIRKKALL